MGIVSGVGTVAAICTTGAFIPQIAKIRKQGGEDLSWGMLGVYFVGVALWLAYGLMIHATAMIWANSSSLLLVAVAIFLKATCPGRVAAASGSVAASASAESETAGN